VTPSHGRGEIDRWRTEAGGGEVGDRTCGVAALALLATLLLAGPAHAADQHGNYVVGGGVGGVTCPEFVNTIDEARRYGVGSSEWATRTQGYVMYILGFQTGYNLAKPGTFDLFANVSTDQVLAQLETWCRQNPLKKFGQGFEPLVDALSPGP